LPGSSSPPVTSALAFAPTSFMRRMLPVVRGPLSVAGLSNDVVAPDFSPAPADLKVGATRPPADLKVGATLGFCLVPTDDWSRLAGTTDDFLNARTASSSVRKIV